MSFSRTYLNDVLFVLYAADGLDWPPLNRTNFQKMLYLCAVLSPITNLNWGYFFTNAAYGPFNKEIHIAVDLLSVRYGYAAVDNLTVTSDSKLRVTYKITSRGQDEVKRITKLSHEKQRLDWIELMMKVLDIYGTKIVAKIAVHEPTYNCVYKKKQKIIDLSSDHNLSIKLLDTLETELQQKYSISLDTLVSKMIVYFDYLSSDIGLGVKE